MRLHRKMIALGIAVVIGSTTALQAQPQGADPKDASTVRSPSFEFPFSDFASESARETFVRRVLHGTPDDLTDITKLRATRDAVDADRVKRLRALYPVTIMRDRIGGVPVQIVKPSAVTIDDGRILINLHGGGFLWGSGNGALVEAIPIAAVSRLPVVTIDYRLAPEARFPAASEDVAAVYRELLKTHPAQSIGLYGCSAGSMLVAQSVVWFQRHDLPRPAAIGMFCFGAAMPGGDSAYIGASSVGQMPQPGSVFSNHPYFVGTDPKDPEVVPIASDSALAQFPPTLMISGTRDFGLSSLLATQAALTRNGVQTDLHVYDGMWHSFMSDPEPAESGEAYELVASFFRDKLSAAQRPKTERK